MKAGVGVASTTSTASQLQTHHHYRSHYRPCQLRLCWCSGAAQLKQLKFLIEIETERRTTDNGQRLTDKKAASFWDLLGWGKDAELKMIARRQDSFLSSCSSCSYANWLAKMKSQADQRGGDKCKCELEVVQQARTFWEALRSIILFL